MAVKKNNKNIKQLPESEVFLDFFFSIVELDFMVFVYLLLVFQSATDK